MCACILWYAAYTHAYLHCFFLLDLFSLHADVFTSDPQDTTVLLGEQAIFSCTFEDIDTFPLWTATDGGTFTTSNTDGDVRYIPVSNTMVSLGVKATKERNGVCYVCIANLITGPIQSAQGCLTLAGKQSMSILCLPAAAMVCGECIFTAPHFTYNCNHVLLLDHLISSRSVTCLRVT